MVGFFKKNELTGYVSIKEIKLKRGVFYCNLLTVSALNKFSMCFQ